VTEGDGVTTEQESEPTAADEETWRPSRRAKVAALVLSVLLVAGITVGIVVINHNQDAPVDAVRAYVDAIARGDASAANAMVDPERFDDGVDPDLLTDEVLGSAKQRITVEDVSLGFDANLSADVVDVQVTYKLGKFGATVLLRAQRAGTTLGVLKNWRVIDPLLVPVRLETNEPEFDTASLGAATVPVGGPVSDGWPERRSFVYPAVYELRGHHSRYLTAGPAEVVATGRVAYDARPANIDEQLAHAALQYQATPELGDEVTTRLTDHVTACVAAAPKVPGDCPWELDAYADFGTGIKLVGRPVVDHLTAYPDEYRRDGKTKPSLRFTGEGQFSYVDEEGEPDETTFFAYGRVVVTPDDDLTVTFSRS
jgi:hypothetical protein